MSNHPNRGWRRRMESAADQWITTDEARSIAETPLRAGDVEGMRKRARMAYIAGYRDRHESLPGQKKNAENVPQGHNES